MHLVVQCVIFVISMLANSTSVGSEHIISWVKQFKRTLIALVLKRYHIVMKCETLSFIRFISENIIVKILAEQ